MKGFCIQGIDMKKAACFFLFLMFLASFRAAPPAQEQSVPLAPSSQDSKTPIPDSGEILPPNAPDIVWLSILFTAHTRYYTTKNLRQRGKGRNT